MRPQTLVVISLRLYTIYLVTASIIQWAQLLSVIVGRDPHGIGSSLEMYLLPPVLIIIIAAILWACTFRLAAQVTKGNNTELLLTSLTKAQLYQFAFVFLGIFFALSSIYSVLQTGFRFFSYDFPRPVDDTEKGLYLSEFLGNLFTLIAGFTSVLGARYWTNKLIRREDGFEKRDSAPSTS